MEGHIGNAVLAASFRNATSIAFAQSAEDLLRCGPLLNHLNPNPPPKLILRRNSSQG